MLATTLLLLFSLALIATAVRNWFTALCGLVVFSVFLQLPAMPHSVLGIQGLNPWNVALLAIFVSWVVQSRRETSNPLTPIPRPALILFGAYVLMLFASGIAAAVDAGAVQGEYPLHKSTFGMLIQAIINPFKYLAVATLVYLGANTPKRVTAALSAAIISTVIYAIMMHATVGVLELDQRQIRQVSDLRIGLHPLALAQSLVFGIWASVVLAILAPTRRVRLGWSACVALIGPALLSTYARNGYASFCAIGIALGVVRWRSLFIWVPLVVLAVEFGSPSVRDRSLHGIATQSETEHDWKKISSGRVDRIWPPVIEQIAEAPILGHGRFAILREPCAEAIEVNGQPLPSHPHNAYLEVLIDAGAVGFAICFAIGVAILRVGFALIQARGDPITMGAGFIALIALASMCIAGLTNGGFYPRQDTIPNLVAIAVACAIYRSRPAVDASSDAEIQSGD